MIKYNAEINDIYELGKLLWAGARERWFDYYSEEDKEFIWDLLEEISESDGGFKSLTAINDFIWFEADELLREHHADLGEPDSDENEEE